VKKVQQIHVKVTTRSSRPRVEEAGEGSYRVHVSSAPDKGKANAEVLKALAGHLGVSRSCLAIKRGGSSRDKTIEVTVDI
jgi:uncharacterized protein